MSVALTACSRVSAFGRPVGEFHSMRSPTRVTSSSNRIWSRPVLRLRRNGLSRAKNTLVGTLQFSRRGRCYLCSDTRRFIETAPVISGVLHKPQGLAGALHRLQATAVNVRASLHRNPSALLLFEE